MTKVASIIRRFIAAGVLFGLAENQVWAYSTNGTSSATAFAVSSTDLLQTDLRSVESKLVLYPEQSFVNGTSDTLTDGTAAFASDPRMYSYTLSGGSIIYTLNTALHPSGYTISAINTYSGWQDTGRVNQHYEVSFRQVGSNTFSNVIPIYYAGTSAQTCVAISNIDLSGVEAICFTFLSQQNGGVGYRELDVFGTASSNAYSITGTSSETAFDVATNDLLQTALLATDDRLGYLSVADFTNVGAAALTDGAFGSASKTDGTCGITNGVITYLLDTSASPAGYQVTEIDSYSGWDDATRDDQHYTVSFRKVGATRFTDAIAVDYTGTVSQARVCITNLDIGNVEAVRFAFPSQENGGAGYKELDVIGAPVVYTNLALTADSQTIASNALANVLITNGTNAASTFTLDSPVTVLNTLTHTATGGTVTLNPSGQTLMLNELSVPAETGALVIGTGNNNGTLANANDHLAIGVSGTSEVTVHASITNGNYSSSLVKFGSGLLTIDATNSYSGDTEVREGTLTLTGNGSLGTGGALKVGDAKLRIAGGSAYAKREVIFTNAVIEQTAGLLRSDNNIQVQNSTLNLMGGNSYVFYDWFLGRKGTNVAMTVSGGHICDSCLVRLEAGNVTVNVQTGSVLYADQIVDVGATGAVLFDGGTLSVGLHDIKYATNTWATCSSGSLSLYVKNGGVTLDTSRGSATLRMPLLQWGSSVGGLTKTGAKTLTMMGSSTYAGDTVVAAGTLKFQPASLLSNGGFEQPALSSATWSYLTSDGVYGGWTMSNNSHAGMARNGSPWVTTAPEGLQVGFLQKDAYMKQTFTIPLTGAYRLTFSGSARPNYQGADAIELKVDGQSVAQWGTNAFDNSGAAFSTQSTTNLILTTGSHEIMFVSSSPDGTDRATAIDNVQLTGVDALTFAGPLPIATRLTVASGATLDLNGAYQTVSELNGSGTLINSASNTVILDVGSDNASTLFSGSIQGNLSLIKEGTGLFTLAGTNTYSGVTTVNGGTLSLTLSTGSASYATTNLYFFVPATNNVLRGLTPTATANLIATPPEGTGSITNLTDGVVMSTGVKTNDYPYIYAIGNNTSLTYTMGAADSGCCLSQITLYSGWGDSGRDNITLSNICYSTVSDPTTFVAITNSAINFTGSSSGAKATLTAAGGFLAVDVYAVRFNFGTQENNYVGYRELEAIGTRPSCLPTGAVITVASGAALNLNGNAQTVAGLSGSGTVTNGMLTVSGIIAPGGTYAIGTLTLAASATLSGTLLIDVAPNGVSDLLNVSGDLDLSNLSLQIQDTTQLKGSTPYVIIQCAPGGLANRFISTNVGTQRSVCYDNASGRVLLVGEGTVIMIR